MVHTDVLQKLIDLLNNAPSKFASKVARMHPLDPLTADEITVAAKICRQYAEKLGESPLRFNAITLQVVLLETEIANSKLATRADF